VVGGNNEAIQDNVQDFCAAVGASSVVSVTELHAINAWDSFLNSPLDRVSRLKLLKVALSAKASIGLTWPYKCSGRLGLGHINQLSVFKTALI
jgi:hypothetical protein